MVSADEGSNGAVKLTVAEPPSLIGPLLLKVAIGATLLTVTLVVYSVKPLSLSMIRPRTVNVPPRLSSKVQPVDVALPEPA